jgi:hypothetical protein
MSTFRKYSPSSAGTQDEGMSVKGEDLQGGSSMVRAEKNIMTRQSNDHKNSSEQDSTKKIQIHSFIHSTNSN